MNCDDQFNLPSMVNHQRQPSRKKLTSVMSTSFVLATMSVLVILSQLLTSPECDFPRLSTGTENLCISGHLELVFIGSRFVSWPFLLLFYVICALVPTEGTDFPLSIHNCITETGSIYTSQMQVKSSKHLSSFKQDANHKLLYGHAEESYKQ